MNWYTLKLQVAGQTLAFPLAQAQCQVVPVGRHAFIHLIDLPLADALPQDVMIGYDPADVDGTGMLEWAPHLLYGNADTLLRPA